MQINYNNKTFRAVQNDATGEVSDETLFHYQQEDQMIWANYSGGQIHKGHLIGTIEKSGKLHFSYHHLNTDFELKTGKCISTPSLLEDGKIRLDESWQWTCGDHSKGKSTLYEV